jgi:uncharacterized protein (TIGR02145 family)
MKQIILSITCIVLAITAGAQTISDIEGNVYNTITLGNQVWMKENLKTGSYRDGSPLNTDWTQVPYVGTASDYAHVHLYDSIYGKLYNWYAVGDARKICPVGFHVPNDAEWIELRTFLGGAAVAGGKMKETGTTNWQAPNTGADNSSGFSARPSGNCANATFMGLGTGAGWWSTTMDTNTGYYNGFGVSYNSTALGGGMTIKSYGNAVRCIGDASTTGIDEIKTIDFTVYPNPARDIINIMCADKIDKIEIYDVMGSLLVATDKRQIEISQLAPGSYFVKVYLANRVAVRQFIK